MIVNKMGMGKHEIFILSFGVFAICLSYGYPDFGSLIHTLQYQIFLLHSANEKYIV